MPASEARVITTRDVRLHVDLKLSEPHDVFALKALREYVEETLADADDSEVQVIITAKVVQIIPDEGERFDWQGQ
jgi:hypothetical protein